MNGAGVCVYSTLCLLISFGFFSAILSRRAECRHQTSFHNTFYALLIIVGLATMVSYIWDQGICLFCGIGMSLMILIAVWDCGERSRLPLQSGTRDPNVFADF